MDTNMRPKGTGAARGNRTPASLPCVVDGCDRPAHAHGLCSGHYASLRRYGDVFAASRAAEGSALERFCSRIELGEFPSNRPDLGRCWLWTGAKGGDDGRPFLRIEGKATLAYRYAYEQLRGPIPAGLTFDHLCRVPGCVNPFHGEIVSNEVNILRSEGLSAKNAASTHCIHGHPFDLLNTYYPPGGHGRVRQCRTCIENRSKAAAK